MPSVLVVDDQPAIRALIRATLEAHGWKVSEAADGEEGLAATLREPPDVVLLDLALPKLAGIDVCRRLHRHPITATLPVLFLSGLDEEVPRQASAAADAQGFISKPFNPAELVKRLDQALSYRASP